MFENLGSAALPSDRQIRGLTVEGCAARIARLRERLDRLGLDAALITDRRHIHYLTGYWTRAVFGSAVLIECDGPTLSSIPGPPENSVCADETRIYPSNRIGTLVDAQQTAAVEVLIDRIGNFRRLGHDGAVPGCAIGDREWIDVQPELFAMRRRKDEDEVDLLRDAVEATEASYAYAKAAIREGITETDLCAGIQAAAAALAGEILGEFGNDFQIGGLGGPPRRRIAKRCEAAILDLSTVLRGYRSDMCRTFIVGAEPNDDQVRAREAVLDVIRFVETTARPGVSCRELYREAKAMLDVHRGWTFPHHLGHGIGLSAHESPRLNPMWDDVLQVGDVFTVEPGLYGPSLREGVRIEEVYLVTEVGLERLTSFPTDYACGDMRGAT